MSRFRSWSYLISKKIKPMKNILIPTDFSKNAHNALFHAVQLAKGRNCTFHLLNVYNKQNPYLNETEAQNLVVLLKNESNEGLRKACHKIMSYNTDPQHIFKSISKKGNLVDIISKTVEKKLIDLVVMGNSGCSEIKAIFLGSNTLNTISGLKQCPILTIPKDIEFKPPKTIAFVTDYKKNYDARLLEPLRAMAKQFNSNICVMRINETKLLDKVQEANRNVLLEYLSPFKCTTHWMPLFKSKATVIEIFINELNIDMLAMVNYEHGFFEKITREPVIKRVAFNLNVPFLIIPEGD